MEHAKKLHFQKILLVGLLIFGVVGISFAFWYRSSEKAKKAEQLESQVVQYANTQTLELQVPVAVDVAEYTNDRVRGRVIENTIQLVGDYNEAVANSRVIAEKELNEGEILWLEPISPEQTIFPMTIKWLVYSDEDANKLLLKEVDKLNINEIDYAFEIEYALSNIEKTNIESTDNITIFYITGEVTLALNELIDIKALKQENNQTIEQVGIKAEADKQSEILNLKSEIVILDTPTDWLNVREGPGTNNPIITKVYPGEIYPQLEESGNWYKIQLGDSQQGWIYSQYANKK